MSQIGGSELLLILLVVLVLFGAKRLPELSRSIGRSARILKSETAALRDEPVPADPAQQPLAPAAAPTRVVTPLPDAAADTRSPGALRDAG